MQPHNILWTKGDQWLMVFKRRGELAGAYFPYHKLVLQPTITTKSTQPDSNLKTSIVHSSWHVIAIFNILFVLMSSFVQIVVCSYHSIGKFLCSKFLQNLCIFAISKFYVMSVSAVFCNLHGCHIRPSKIHGLNVCGPIAAVKFARYLPLVKNFLPYSIILHAEKMTFLFNHHWTTDTIPCLQKYICTHKYCDSLLQARTNWS